MQKLIDMTTVSDCEVVNCAYNTESQCHAKAITVGDGITPACDTFFRGDGNVNDTQIIAGVGACKVSGCDFNEDLECTAEAVKVGRVNNVVHCLSYH